MLARWLGDRLDLPVYTIDDIQWQPGWTPVPAAEVATRHQEWLLTPKWIIDGWGNWDILAQRFEAADTIILVDFHLLVHYWWTTKRQLKAVFKLEPGWPPPGCPALPITGRLFKLMWQIHHEQLPQLVELILQYQADTTFVHLRSPRQMRYLLQDIETGEPP